MEPIFTNDRIRNALSTLATFADILDGYAATEDLESNRPESCDKVIDMWRRLRRLIQGARQQIKAEGS